MKSNSTSIKVIASLVLMGIGIVVYIITPVSNLTEGEDQGCLSENEVAGYEFINEGTTKATAIVKVEDKNTKEEKDIITINNVRTNYHPVELHECGIYLTKEFGFDSTTSTFSPDFNWTVWKYDYNGNSTTVITLAEKKDNKEIVHFSNDFRVDPNEKYITLEKGYLGSPDYSLTIKNINTLEDVFVLPKQEVRQNSPDLVGTFGFEGWTKDGRYFWANISGGAQVFGFIRIDSKTWDHEIFKAPPDTLGGEQLNLETGWLTVHPGNEWYGVHSFTQAEKERRRAEGTGTSLYIYNLFTEEKRLVDQTDEPLHWSRPRWVSDTKLEYEMPSGETKTYILDE